MIKTFCKKCNREYWILPKDKQCPWCLDKNNSLKLVATVVVIMIFILAIAMVALK